MKQNWDEPFSKEFAYRVGLNDEAGKFIDPQTKSDMSLDNKNNIAEVNDDIFTDDSTFTNMRVFILNNIEYIFIPKVAQKLKQHYGV